MAVAKKKKILKKKVVKMKKTSIKKKLLKVKKTSTKKKIVKVQKKVLIKKGVSLKRAIHNPIIEPREYSWESKATLNPAAIISDNNVHLVYRAIGDDDSSVLGYAGSPDGYNFYDRPQYAIYRRYNNFSKDKTVLPIDYVSGGGWNGGCEDPRLTLLGDTVYMLYTAFDGWGSLRIALTSIPLNDFKKKKWNWKKPVLISPPGEIHKNWVIFPEKINGKFAILHSFYPNILIDYFDSLDELDGNHFIRSNNTRPVDQDRTWDSWFRGVGPTPIKTELGWLILYHAMDHKNPDRYKMGALILDPKDPTKVLYRSPSPILEPETDYENNGYKWGVVYSCGAIVKNGELFVYYGGADKVIGVATIKLSELLDDLKKHKVIKLKKQSVQI
jgi:predicted GH43/DUF377 family glycosyl hydrolase